MSDTHAHVKHAAQVTNYILDPKGKLFLLVCGLVLGVVAISLMAASKILKDRALKQQAPEPAAKPSALDEPLMPTGEQARDRPT